MQRLGFKMAPFTRIIWSSEEAKNLWEPRITRIKHAWNIVERLSVARNVRSAAIQFCHPNEMGALIRDCLGHDLDVLVLAKNRSTNGYSSRAQTPIDGEDWEYRVGLVNNSIVGAQLIEAFDFGEDDKVGALLGFPRCCREFFQRFWVEEGMIDPTFLMGRGDVDCRTNILLRALGVRLVPHLPCSTDCSRSIDLADQLLRVARDLGYHDEMGWAQELLSMPMEWTALHGIAEIKTPIFKLATDTDSTGDKVTFNFSGTHYPTGSAQGMTFPYRPMIKDVGPVVRDSWSANGFPSRIAMEQAHDKVIPFIRRAINLCHNDGIASPTVVDFGCGNGLLVRKACYGSEALAVGIEIDPERAAGQPSVICIDMFNEGIWDMKVDVAILQPGRLEERKDETFLKNLNRAKVLVLYNYDGRDILRLRDLVGINGTLVNAADTVALFVNYAAN